MSINSKAKGKRGELEVVALLRECGVPARRGVQYEGSAGSPDVAHALDPIVHLEVKMQAKVMTEDWYDQAAVDAVYRIPVVVHRRSSRKASTPWRATLSAAHLAMLLGDAGHMDLEHGSAVEIATCVSRLPVTSRIVQVDALRFDAEMKAVEGGVLFHARRNYDSLWMASLDARKFVEDVLVPYAVREFDYKPRYGTDEYTPEDQREWERFWEPRRDRLADLMPLFTEAA